MTTIPEPSAATTSKTPVAKKPVVKKDTNKKAPAKRPVAKKGVKPPAKKGTTNEVFAKWKAGAKISELVKAFKLTRPQVRRYLLSGAGSREAFKALRKQGAGGTWAKGDKAVAK
jgi:hypothetical protein